MVQASKLLSEKESETEMQMTRMGLPTFSLNPQLKEDEHIHFSTADDQTKLMCWHYHLGHLAFSKLKQLAINGKVP